MTTEMQLEIEGIGQQLATLADWKKDHAVFTHKSWASHHGEKPWNAWAGNPRPLDHLETNGEGAFGFGETEKEAILNLCEKENIEPPFWWKI